jgi:hypothetical protein
LNFFATRWVYNLNGCGKALFIVQNKEIGNRANNIKGTGGGGLTVIQLGPFLLNVELLLFILSAFAGYLALKSRLSKAEMKEDISGKYATAIILGIFIWKFSILLFDPISTVQHPLSLLYFNGGVNGIVLAVTLSIGFIWFRSRMDSTSIMMNLDVLVAGLIVGSSLYHLLLILTENTNLLFHSLYILLNITLGLFHYGKKEAVGNPVVVTQFVIWFSVGMIGISFTVEDRDLFMLGFTKEQTLFLIVFLIFYLIDFVRGMEKGGS